MTSTPFDTSNESLSTTRTTTIARRRRREILNIRKTSHGMASSASIERAVASAIENLKHGKHDIDKESSMPSKIRKVCIGESEVVVKTELLVDPATLLDEVSTSPTALLQKNKSTTTKSTYSSTTRRTTTTTTETTTSTSKQYHQKTSNKNISKEEASAMRREARRVRNRESAAASRAKIRNRISELEEEVNMWKNEAMSWKEKYDNDTDEEIKMWKDEAQNWKGKYEKLNESVDDKNE